MAAALVVCGIAIGTACAAQHDFLVTVSPLDAEGHFCLAVDLADPHGVWWWHAPTGSDCETRITSAVIHPDRTLISAPRPDGSRQISFRLVTMSSDKPFVDRVLVLKDDAVGEEGQPRRVALRHRRDLEIPSAYGK